MYFVVRVKSHWGGEPGNTGNTRDSDAVPVSFYRKKMPGGATGGGAGHTRQTTNLTNHLKTNQGVWTGV